ncbi:MAG: hypothetical protein J1F03_07050, partial [Oscillospiraceae bacterium]|nr:hypothetical protein [Oscillospiraceae bacterium]
MGNVIKSSRYRMISNHSFELPLPLKYELFREDNPVAEYEVSSEEKVSCRILTKFKEEMLTPVQRPIVMSDIYYFLSTRVFQDNTPFTYSELALLGLEKYNVYEILRKTRGITPYDKYWLKFSGDDCKGYDEALSNFNELMTPKNVCVPPSAPSADASADMSSNISPAESAQPSEPAPEPQETPTAAESASSSGGTMSQDDIEKMLAAATAEA